MTSKWSFAVFSVLLCTTTSNSVHLCSLPQTDTVHLPCSEKRPGSTKHLGVRRQPHDYFISRDKQENLEFSTTFLKKASEARIPVQCLIFDK